MPYKLSHPEYLTLTGPDGTRYRGGDQEWYHDLWQRRAGCGPTTAAALLSYLKEENLIETRGRAMTCSRRINGVRTECVCLRVDTGEITADDDLF